MLTPEDQAAMQDRWIALIERCTLANERAADASEHGAVALERIASTFVVIAQEGVR